MGFFENAFQTRGNWKRSRFDFVWTETFWNESYDTLVQGRSQKKILTEAMSMNNLWLRQSVHGWVLFLGIRYYKQQLKAKEMTKASASVGLLLATALMWFPCSGFPKWPPIVVVLCSLDKVRTENMWFVFRVKLQFLGHGVEAAL